MRDYTRVDNDERILAHEKCIRRAAYDTGYQDGYDTKENLVSENHYQRGVNDAWMAFLKLTDIAYEDEMRKIFDADPGYVKYNVSPREILTRIKEYEDIQNHEYIDGKDGEDQSIEIGDIVNIGVDRCIVTFIYNDGKWDGITSSGSVCRNQYISDAKKTGERFDAFPLLLKNLKSASKL